MTEIAKLLDPDNALGSVAKVVKIADYKEGRNGPYSWRFSDDYPKIVENGNASIKDPSYPGWSYVVRYVIDVGRIEN